MPPTLVGIRRREASWNSTPSASSKSVRKDPYRQADKGSWTPTACRSEKRKGAFLIICAATGKGGDLFLSRSSCRGGEGFARGGFFRLDSAAT